MELGVYGSIGVAGGQDCIIEHNTVYNCRYSCTLFYEDGDGARNTRVRDNIFNAYQGASWEYANWPYNENDGNNNFSDYILYSQSIAKPIKEADNEYSLDQWRSNLHSDYDNHSIHADPEFVNLSGNMNQIADFALSTESPGYQEASDAKDMGINSQLVGIED